MGIEEELKEEEFQSPSASGPEEGSKKLESESPSTAATAAPASSEEKPTDDSKALVVSDVKILSDEPADRDLVLSRLESEKRMALIKAWEESEKTKAENKAYRKLIVIGSWESTKKASVEAQLKKIEEKFEKKKAEYAEQMKNKIAIICKEAEERRAMVEAERGEGLLKAEETAARYRVAGVVPRKILGCFGNLLKG